MNIFGGKRAQVLLLAPGPLPCNFDGRPQGFFRLRPRPWPAGQAQRIRRTLRESFSEGADSGHSAVLSRPIAKIQISSRTWPRCQIHRTRSQELIAEEWPIRAQEIASEIWGNTNDGAAESETWTLSSK